MRRCTVTFLIAVFGSSFVANLASASHRNTKFQFLAPPVTLPSLQRRRRQQCLFYIDDANHGIPRGGSQSEATVSVNADETLPLEIAGASLRAFHANVPASDTADTTHRIHTTPQTEELEQGVDISEDVTVQDSVVPSVLTKRLTDLRQRTLPAALMLMVVGSIAKFLKEDGLIALTLLLQLAMYQEATKVIGGEFPHPFYKWWWFLTASVGINAPRIFSWASKEIASCATAMAIVGVVSTVIRFNYKKANVEEFRDYLRQAAVSFMAIVSRLRRYSILYSCQSTPKFESSHANTASSLCAAIHACLVPCCHSIFLLDRYTGRVRNEMGSIASGTRHHQ